MHRFDPASGADVSWGLSGQPGAALLDRTGAPIIATPNGLARLDEGTGVLEQLVSVEADRPESRANDGKVDTRGRVWLGTMPSGKRPREAGLYRVDGHVVTRVVSGLTISNGPALDETAGRLYLADTALGIVDAFDFDPARGEVSGRRRFLDVSDDGIWPDGMTVDDEGCLWVAFGRAGQVRRYGPDGTLHGVVELPVANPTSLAFGGDDGGDLYITTSWFDVPDADRAAQPLAGALFRCRRGVSGRPMPRASLAS